MFLPTVYQLSSTSPGVRTHIDRHIVTNIPQRRIFWLFCQIDHQACAARLTEFMLFVLRSKTVHGKLAFASAEREVSAEWVDIQVAVDLAHTAVAFIDVYG